MNEPQVKAVASDALLGKEIPNSEGKWIRAGGNHFACTVQREKPIPGFQESGDLIIFFKRGNYWRVRNLPTGLRGGWHRMPNPTVEGRTAKGQQT